MVLLKLQQMGGVCGSYRFDDSEREGSLVGWCLFRAAQKQPEALSEQDRKAHEALCCSWVFVAWLNRRWRNLPKEQEAQLTAEGVTSVAFFEPVMICTVSKRRDAAEAVQGCLTDARKNAGALRRNHDTTGREGRPGRVRVAALRTGSMNFGTLTMSVFLGLVGLLAPIAPCQQPTSRFLRLVLSS